MAQPLSSVQPSSHQPSSTEQLTTPFMAAFMPLVPDASSGRRGLLSQTSDALDQVAADAHVVVLEDDHAALERASIGCG